MYRPDERIYGLLTPAQVYTDALSLHCTWFGNRRYTPHCVPAMRRQPPPSSSVDTGYRALLDACLPYQSHLTGSVTRLGRRTEQEQPHFESAKYLRPPQGFLPPRPVQYRGLLLAFGVSRLTLER